MSTALSRRLTREDINAPESWCCIDCGFNTAPGFSTKEEMWREFASKKAVKQTADTKSEIYMVHDHVWRKAGMEAFSGCLCVGCLEKRIGRPLIQDDFTDHVFNTTLPGTPRLLERQGRRYNPLGDWRGAA